MNADDIRYTVETLNFTRTLPFDMQSKFVDLVLETSEAQTLRVGTVLFKEGDTEGDEGYILLSGDITVSSQQKPEFTVPGPELLGEMKQFNPNNLRTSTVEALEDVNVLAFTWASLWAAAHARFGNPTEVEQLKEALSNYAWEHFSW